MKAYTAYTTKAHTILIQAKQKKNRACLKSLTREVTTHIRTDAQGGPLIPVFGVKTPHEINE